MVNDAHQGPAKNSVIKIIDNNNTHHLCLFALRNIEENEELRYDYGDPNLPWRKKTPIYKV